MNALLHIKRLVLQGRIRFTAKAKEEMQADDLQAMEVIEAIVNAETIDKVLRSHSPHRSHPSEKLYVIKSYSYQGTPIYTKGKIAREGEKEVFYILISAKLRTL